MSEPSGPVPDGQAGSLTLSDWVQDHWLPLMKTQVKPSTWDSYDRNLRLHVLPRLGDLPLGRITPMMLNRLYADLLESGRLTGSGGGLAAKTVQYIAFTVHEVLTDAVDTEVLATNPADRAKAPRPAQVAPADLRFWTADQLHHFLTFSKDHRLAAAWRVAATTGMRRGEILGLRWDDVDLEAERLAVRHAIISVGYHIIESTPKSHRARVVDLDAETIRQLRSHRDRQQEERVEHGDGYQDGDLVFCREDGRAIQPDIFSQAFKRLAVRAGLPRIPLHGLRHTWATLALRAGVPTKVVSERLGHATPGFTLKQYAHSIPGMQREAAHQIADLVDRAESA